MRIIPKKRRVGPAIRGKKQHPKPAIHSARRLAFTALAACGIGLSPRPAEAALFGQHSKTVETENTPIFKPLQEGLKQTRASITQNSLANDLIPLGLFTLMPLLFSFGGLSARGEVNSEAVEILLSLNGHSQWKHLLCDYLESISMTRFFDSEIMPLLDQTQQRELEERLMPLRPLDKLSSNSRASLFPALVYEFLGEEGLTLMFKKLIQEDYNSRNLPQFTLARVTALFKQGPNAQVQIDKKSDQWRRSRNMAMHFETNFNYAPAELSRQGTINYSRLVKLVSTLPYGQAIAAATYQETTVVDQLAALLYLIEVQFGYTVLIALIGDELSESQQNLARAFSEYCVNNELIQSEFTLPPIEVPQCPDLFHAISQSHMYSRELIDFLRRQSRFGHLYIAHRHGLGNFNNLKQITDVSFHFAGPDNIFEFLRKVAPNVTEHKAYRANFDRDYPSHADRYDTIRTLDIETQLAWMKSLGYDPNLYTASAVVWHMRDSWGQAIEALTDLKKDEFIAQAIDEFKVLQQTETDNGLATAQKYNLNRSQNLAQQIESQLKSGGMDLKEFQNHIRFLQSVAGIKHPLNQGQISQLIAIASSSFQHFQTLAEARAYLRRQPSSVLENKGLAGSNPILKQVERLCDEQGVIVESDINQLTRLVDKEDSSQTASDNIIRIFTSRGFDLFEVNSHLSDMENEKKALILSRFCARMTFKNVRSLGTNAFNDDPAFKNALPRVFNKGLLAAIFSGRTKLNPEEQKALAAYLSNRFTFDEIVQLGKKL